MCCVVVWMQLMQRAWLWNMSAVCRAPRRSECSCCLHSVNDIFVNSLLTRQVHSVPEKLMCGRLISSNTALPCSSSSRALQRHPAVAVVPQRSGTRGACVLEAHLKTCLCLLEQPPQLLRNKAFALCICMVCW